MLDSAGLPLLGINRPERATFAGREIVVEQPNGIPVGYVTPSSSGLLKSAAALGLGAAGAAFATRATTHGLKGLAARTALESVSVRSSVAEGRLRHTGHLRWTFQVGEREVGGIYASSSNSEEGGEALRRTPPTAHA